VLTLHTLLLSIMISSRRTQCHSSLRLPSPGHTPRGSSRIHLRPSRLSVFAPILSTHRTTNATRARLIQSRSKPMASSAGAVKSLFKAMACLPSKCSGTRSYAIASINTHRSRTHPSPVEAGSPCRINSRSQSKSRSCLTNQKTMRNSSHLPHRKRRSFRSRQHSCR